MRGNGLAMVVGVGLCLPARFPSGMAASIPDQGAIMFCPLVKGFSGEKPHHCLLYKHKPQCPEEDGKTSP